MKTQNKTNNVIAKAIKEEAQESKEKQQPEAKFRSGSLQATVWKNESKDKKSNEVITNYNFTIERSYTKDDGKTFEHTGSFRKRDIANVNALMHRITDFLMIDEDEEQEEQIY
jgi:hypothetical protein